MFDDNDNTHFLVPAATYADAWQLWVVSISYLILSVAAITAVVQAIRLKSAFSFRSAFLFVSFLFCICRGFVSLIYYSGWSRHMFWLYLICYFTPIYLQYWTFSLLVLFVVKCIYVINNRGHMIKKCLYPTFHLCQTVLFGICLLASAVLAHKWNDSEDQDLNASWDKDPSIYTAMLYFMLTVVGAYYAFRCYELFKNIEQSAHATQRRRKLRMFLVLIPVFFVIFFMRGLWNVLYYFDANPVQRTISNWIKQKNTASFNWAFLIFYMFFEIIPTALVVILFARSLQQQRQPYSTMYSDGRVSSNNFHSDLLSSHVRGSRVTSDATDKKGDDRFLSDSVFGGDDLLDSEDDVDELVGVDGRPYSSFQNSRNHTEYEPPGAFTNTDASINDSSRGYGSYTETGYEDELSSSVGSQTYSGSPRILFSNK